MMTNAIELKGNVDKVHGKDDACCINGTESMVLLASSMTMVVVMSMSLPRMAQSLSDKSRR